MLHLAANKTGSCRRLDGVLVRAERYASLTEVSIGNGHHGFRSKKQEVHSGHANNTSSKLQTDSQSGPSPSLLYHQLPLQTYISTTRADQHPIPSLLAHPALQHLIPESYRMFVELDRDIGAFAWLKEHLLETFELFLRTSNGQCLGVSSNVELYCFCTCNRPAVVDRDCG